MPPGIPPSAKSLEADQWVRIKSGSSPNVRSEPGTAGRRLGNARSGQTYALLAVKNNWYRIRLENGTEGWISANMASIVH